MYIKGTHHIGAEGTQCTVLGFRLKGVDLSSYFTVQIFYFCFVYGKCFNTYTFFRLGKPGTRGWYLIQ
jgi:hypothetical protein